MIKKYELMYIVDQDVKEDDVKAVQDKMNAIITKNGGKIEDEANWGLKDFAYEINHKKKGTYISVIAMTTPEDVEEFQRVAGIDKNVVRNLVINTEKDHDYVASTKMSKTDMTKFDEERAARRNNNFRKPRFNRNDDNEGNDAEATEVPNEKAARAEKFEKSEKAEAKKAAKPVSKKAWKAEAEEKPAKKAAPKKEAAAEKTAAKKTATKKAPKAEAEKSDKADK